MGQKSQLLWDLPPTDTFNILKELYDINDSQFNSMLDECLTILNVGHKLNTPVRHLSLGERMKFEIIASLLHQPQLLFLDEPTTGLDPLSARQFDELIVFLRDALNLTVLMISHDIESLKTCTDRVAFVGEGKVLALEPIDQLMKNTHPLIAEYFSRF